jgi:hypothetical protein
MFSIALHPINYYSSQTDTLYFILESSLFWKVRFDTAGATVFTVKSRVKKKNHEKENRRQFVGWHHVCFVVRKGQAPGFSPF